LPSNAPPSPPRVGAPRPASASETAPRSLSLFTSMSTAAAPTAAASSSVDRVGRRRRAPLLPRRAGIEVPGLPRPPRRAQPCSESGSAPRHAEPSARPPLTRSCACECSGHMRPIVVVKVTLSQGTRGRRASTAPILRHRRSPHAGGYTHPLRTALLTTRRSSSTSTPSMTPEQRR